MRSTIRVPGNLATKRILAANAFLAHRIVTPRLHFADTTIPFGSPFRGIRGAAATLRTENLRIADANRIPEREGGAAQRIETADAFLTGGLIASPDFAVDLAAISLLRSWRRLTGAESLDPTQLRGVGTIRVPDHGTAEGIEIADASLTAHVLAPRSSVRRTAVPNPGGEIQFTLTGFFAGIGCHRDTGLIPLKIATHRISPTHTDLALRGVTARRRLCCTAVRHELAATGPGTL